LSTTHWQTPLSAFRDQSEDDVRAMKSLGPRGGIAVVEAIRVIHDMLSSLATQPHLTTSLVPRSVYAIDCLFDAGLRMSRRVSMEAVVVGLATPLIDQVRQDLSPRHLGLVEQVLETSSTRQLEPQRNPRGQLVAESLELRLAMSVRWPQCAIRLNEI